MEIIKINYENLINVNKTIIFQNPFTSSSSVLIRI